MARPKQNLYGQEMGSKGFLTREKIIATTTELLGRRPLREIKVAEIGQSAGVSTSTFYIYFETVSDAALAAIERVNQASPEIINLMESPWPRNKLLQNSRALVNMYFSIWDKHHALLRVRNFVADEGDKRFIDARRRSIEPLLLRFQDKVRELQEDLPEERRLDPASTVSVLLAMLERTAQVIRLPSAHRATRPRQVETAAFLVASALSGGVPFLDEMPAAKGQSGDYFKGDIEGAASN
ncbi:TetR family transcriptional regulator [Croceicoccus sp. BE223]|uniref:TetR/AcrR family transcriptional regulator n=1 Tax=Croceicoccus sp. BE223 TaxID=2817716 RepID=UPI002856A904|nr:TetR family transcriptional regulator [Croceicoccus sp. BE223]MDR7103669.1 AcrR family transcriptional regulator [Croceicoccus sp. BE223]